MPAKIFTWTLYIKSFPEHFPFDAELPPWRLTQLVTEHLHQLIHSLSGDDYLIADGVATHRTAIIEQNVTLKPPVIAGPDCFIAANAYLRGGVWLIGKNCIGPGCEIKSSVLFPRANLAHFNFIGDSVIGSRVNFEAGSITANHFNEKDEKEITVILKGKKVRTGTTKFGSLVGDGCRIGANAVLSPGTVLAPGKVVRRLELVDQMRKK